MGAGAVKPRSFAKGANFTIRREILWESETAADSQVRAKEIEFINVFRSNDPAIGYNKWPKQTSR